jgi:hypothetical protein
MTVSVMGVALLAVIGHNENLGEERDAGDWPGLELGGIADDRGAVGPVGALTSHSWMVTSQAWYRGKLHKS